MSVEAYATRVGNRISVDPVILWIVAFFVIHMLIRLFGFANFSVDETESAVHTQVFSLFYKFNNPPLFDWLFYATSRLFGVNAFSMQVAKTSLIAGGAVFFYLAIRPAFRHRLALTAAIAGYGATAFFGWDIFQQFSHTNALIFSIGFTFWAFMGVVRAARVADYVWLGLALGLGVLSKYLFVLYFVALTVAALRSPRYRAAILNWRMAITLVMGILVISPLIAGYSNAFADVTGALGDRVAGSSSGPDLKALGYLFVLTAEFWLPLVAILCVCLWRWPATGEVGEPNEHRGDADESIYPLARDATIFMIVVMLAAVFVLGTKISSGRYLISILSLLPLAIVAGIDRSVNFPTRAMNQFQRGAVAFIVGIVVVRFLIFLFTSPPFCVPRCVVFVDYAPVVEKILASDGKQTVLLSDHVHIASNLLRQLPNARVVMSAYTTRLDLSIADPAARNCYLVWFQKYRASEEKPLELALQRVLGRPPAESERAAIESVDYVKAEWRTWILWDWGPDTIVGIAKIESASPMCATGRLPEAPET